LARLLTKPTSHGIVSTAEIVHNMEFSFQLTMESLPAGASLHRPTAIGEPPCSCPLSMVMCCVTLLKRSPFAALCDLIYARSYCRIYGVLPYLQANTADRAAYGHPPLFHRDRWEYWDSQASKGPPENPPANNQQLCLSCQYASSEDNHKMVLAPLCF
jgi:hypothetical protein